jgi:hypothetical protein
MKLSDLYFIIKPLIDIFIFKYFYGKIEFAKNIISIINLKAISKLTGTDSKCYWIYKLYYLILLLIMLLAFIWIIYDIIAKNYYFITANFNLLLKDNISLKDIPEFYQISNIMYFTDIFSIDIGIMIFIGIIAISIAIIYFFHTQMNITEIYTEFNLFILVLVISFSLGIIFIIYNFNNLNLLSRRNNNIIQIIYKNINIQFINNQVLCNYLHKNSIFDDYFSSGKCNDIRNLFTQQKLYSYISGIMNEIYSNNNNNITGESFKVLKDNNGILYKDRLSSAFFTFSLIHYYIDNNLVNEAKEFFSTFNLIKLQFKPRINPILNLSYDSILMKSIDLSYTIPEMQMAFNENQEIYNLVYNDFYNINSTIQNIIADIYNICKYKMLCIYYYYLIIFILMILVIVYYFIKNKYNFN